MASDRLRSWIPVVVAFAFTACAGRTQYVVVERRTLPVPTSARGEAPRLRAGEELARRGDEIVVCGRLFHTGTRVVLFADAGGYDAYRPHRHFEPDEILPSRGEEVPRYGSFRRGLSTALAERVRRDGWRLEDLQQVVHQVVLHYDAAGTSARCFEILHDVRGLSSHFLLDLDGTIYQTLDLKERAWHAGETNDRSVGIEIANIGAYADAAELARWYAEEGNLSILRLPEGTRRGALPEDTVLRPARRGPLVGEIHGRTLFQQDFTDAQYEALGHLLASLSRVLPRCRLEVPRAADGGVLGTTLPEGDARPTFEGVLGHWHVSPRKVDPGPAFDWDRVLERSRVLRAR